MPSDRPPPLFDRFATVRRLARGGSAELYLALQSIGLDNERPVVIKHFRNAEAGADTQELFHRQFLREAQVLANLDHQNIPKIFEIGILENAPYIAMEYIAGADLRALVGQLHRHHDPSFPLRHVISIIIGVALGLDHFHNFAGGAAEQEFVHRDISPQNIMLSFDGAVKVIDFGIAKARSSDANSSMHGKLKGKLAYMSPEQLEGGALDRRSDIFSLGTLLFELTTGKRLFRAKQPMDAVEMILKGTYPTPRSLNPDIPPDLESIIMRALCRQPRKRFSNAAELAGALEDFAFSNGIRVSTLDLARWMHELFAERAQIRQAQNQSFAELAQALREHIQTTMSQEYHSLRPEGPSKSKGQKRWFEWF